MKIKLIGKNVKWECQGMTMPLMASPSKVLSHPLPGLMTESRIRFGVDNFFRECIPTINGPIW